jgi:hypothetical protein
MYSFVKIWMYLDGVNVFLFLMNVQYLVKLSDHRQELKNWHSSFNTPIYKTRLQNGFLIPLIESNNTLLIHEMSSHATIHKSMAPNSNFLFDT